MVTLQILWWSNSKTRSQNEDFKNINCVWNVRGKNYFLFLMEILICEELHWVFCSKRGFGIFSVLKCVKIIKFINFSCLLLRKIILLMFCTLIMIEFCYLKVWIVFVVNEIIILVCEWLDTFSIKHRNTVLWYSMLCQFDKKKFIFM